MTSRGMFVVAFGAALFAFGGDARVRADDASEAQVNFELGVLKRNAGRYEEALEAFLASNRLVPNADVAYNVAFCFLRLGRVVESYNWLEAYLTEYELTEEQRATGLDAQRSLERRVALVEVTTEPAGAVLFVTSTSLGSIGRSNRRVAVEPGEATLIARLDGHAETRGTVEVRRGQSVPLALSLPPLLGALALESHPPGATVLTEDGEELGTTPLEVALPVGEHALALRLDGHVERTARFTLANDERRTLTVRLPRDASRVAVLTVRGTPEAATVAIAGEVVGLAPLTLEAVDPGQASLRIEAPGLVAYETVVPLEPGGATRVDFRLAPPDPGPPAWRLPAYAASIGIGVTGAILGGLALRRNRQLEDDPLQSGAIVDQIDRLNVAADVLMASGLVGLAFTLGFDLARPDDAPVSEAEVTIDR